MRSLQRLSCWTSPIVGKHCPTLFTFNICFTNQRKCEIFIFLKVDINYYVLKCINALYIQMPKPTVSKFTGTIYLQWLCQISYICSMHLGNFISTDDGLFHLPWRNTIEASSSWGIFFFLLDISCIKHIVTYFIVISFICGDQMVI